MALLTNSNKIEDGTCGGGKCFNILRPDTNTTKNGIKKDLTVLDDTIKNESRNCGIALLLFASKELLGNSNNFNS